MTDAQYFDWLANPARNPVVLAEVVASVNGTDTTFYLSTKGYTTGPGDTPAHQHYLEVLNPETIQTTEALALDTDAPSMTIGDVELLNLDGALDAWLTYVWSGRSNTLLFGDMSWARTDFRVVAAGITDDIDSKDRTTLNLKLRDKMQRLNGAVTEATLGGTGTNKDAVIPQTFGEVANITPLLVDAATLKYRVHSTTISAILQVRDNGVPVNFTDNHDGTFTLAQAPYGTITCSVQGDTGGGSYVTTLPDIVQRIATGFGPSATRLSSADMDTSNLSSFKSAHPQQVGQYLSQRTNVIDACNELASSLGAQVTMSRTGLLRLLQVDLANLSPTFTIQPWHIDERSLHIARRLPAVAAVKLGFCRNYTPQPDLATNIPAAAKSLLATEYMPASAVDAPTQSLYKLTSDAAQQNTLLIARADADGEVQRRLALRKVPRMVYQFDGYADLFQLELGQHVTLVNSRFNLGSGVNGMVVSLDVKWGSNRVTVGVLI